MTLLVDALRNQNLQLLPSLQARYVNGFQVPLLDSEILDPQ